jgi:hypothetical protein
MGTLSAKAIYCPNEKEHPRKKILLLLQKENLMVHCKDHGWIKIKMSKFGKPINFDGVAVELEAVVNNGFDLSPVPLIAVGTFGQISGRASRKVRDHA